MILPFLSGWIRYGPSRRPAKTNALANLLGRYGCNSPPAPPDVRYYRIPIDNTPIAYLSERQSLGLFHIRFRLIPLTPQFVGETRAR